MTEVVAITGSMGFIGLHLANYLINNSENTIELHLIDNFSRQKRDRAVDKVLKNKNVIFHEGDLSSDIFVESLPSSFQTIFHLAALNGTQNFYESPDQVLISSTIPTLLLLNKYSKLSTFEKFIYSGSSESYATGVKYGFVEVPTKENVILSIENPINPRWSYSISKTHGEVATASFCSKYKKKWQILRLHNIIGTRMGDKHFIPDFLSRAKKDKFELFGWDDTRSFLAVEDAVYAMFELKNNIDSFNQIINIGSDNEQKILHLAEKIMSILERNDRIKLYPSPEGSVKRRVPDISKLKSYIPDFPRISVDDVIFSMVKEAGLI